MFLTNMKRRKSDSGGILIAVLIVFAVVMLFSVVVFNRGQSQLRVAHHLSLKSDARRVLDYYAGIMRHRGALVENLKPSHNPDLFQYVKVRPTSDVPPPSCPRIENCKDTAPPAKCNRKDYDPPPCLDPPPWQEMKAYDAGGNVVIPKSGVGP